MKQQPIIVFEDEQVVVVNKPANFLSIPDRYKEDLPNVQKFLKATYEEIFTVHRLDKETSGILLFAKTAEAHKHLSEQFTDRQVQKYYLALTSGQIAEAEGIIDKPIAKHSSKNKMIVAKQGKPSLSEFKVMERFQQHTLVEVQIKTGRTHQIRVHFQAIGYPLMVDPIYSRNEAFYLSELKGKKYRSRREEVERPLISRCTLHAHSLQFTHPATGEEMRFEVDPPKDFRATLQQLRKWSSIS